MVELVQKFVNHVIAVKLVENVTRNYTYNDTMYKFEELNKWYKVLACDSSGHNLHVYCFIAKSDFETKQLGKVKAGDIHKPASYKQPAKHPRGSVFDQSTWNCAGPYGIAYLRG